MPAARQLPFLALAALLAACSTPPAPVAVAGAAPTATAAPSAGTGAQDAAVQPILGMPIKAVVNGKPLAGYDLTILDPITDKPLPVLATPPASGSAIVASEAPKTGPDGSFKFLLVLDKVQSVISNGGGSLIASGGGNLIASGGGNLIASGGGNLIASGGGNLIASGGGNLIASGGGNLIASGGGNLIASGGGNLIASGGGNLTTTGDVNLRVVAAGLGGRVEAVSALGPAGFGRVYRTLQVPGDVVMNVASTITAHLAVTMLKESENLPPEERAKFRAEGTKTLGDLGTKLETALAANPELATQIMQSGTDPAAAVGTDALIGQFLATSGLAADVPNLLSPEIKAAVQTTAPPPPGPAGPAAPGGTSGGGGSAPAPTDFTPPPIETQIDLH